MWSPTHVQVTVQRAKDLLTKGKHKTNDCFVTIALGKEKYQTSVKQKATKDVEWHEECELLIPEQGNTAEIVLTALHRNFVGVDEFLGTVSIPLSSFDVYERPKNRWCVCDSVNCTNCGVSCKSLPHFPPTGKLLSGKRNRRRLRRISPTSLITRIPFCILGA